MREPEKFWLIAALTPGDTRPLILDRVYSSSAEAATDAADEAARAWDKGTVYVVMSPGDAFKGRKPVADRVWLNYPSSLDQPADAPPPGPDSMPFKAGEF